MTKRPIVFIGSAGESKDVVRAIESRLDEVARPVPWSITTFEPGAHNLETLTEHAERSDFAVFVMAGVDETQSRGSDYLAPRDNVVFELGLFIGRLGRERCYFVCDADESDELKVPSDLAGIASLKYIREEDRELEYSLGKACNAIIGRIGKLGPRQRTSDAEAFCLEILGTWWECITSQPERTISVMQVELDENQESVTFRGRSYDLAGGTTAHWKSTGTIANPSDRSLRYFWKGWVPSKVGEPREGYGEKSFDRAGDAFKSGHGKFSDFNLTHPAKTHQKSVVIRRCSAEEHEVMHGSDTAKKIQLIKATIDQLNPAKTQS